MKAALGDAALMTAMERNADLVVMQCYAPLLVNVNPGGRQWRPNLIGYDALRAFGSPSYYAIQMFSRNIGDEILKSPDTDTAVLASATRDSKTGTIFVKLVNPNATAAPVQLDWKGTTVRTATALTMAADANATNSIDAMDKVVPVSSKVDGARPGLPTRSQRMASSC